MKVIFLDVDGVVCLHEKKNDWIYISIADNGTGIPDNIKERVFEMFFTGNHPIADSLRSLGLGLPLCKAIINAHGGEITLKDMKTGNEEKLPMDEQKIKEIIEKH